MSSKILVIEDEAPLRAQVVEMLELEGYDVSEAENGGIALGLLQNLHPDIIICDIAMPDFDGYQILEHVRDNERLAMIPFIFVTARSDRSFVRHGMDLGADDYITKPIKPRVLMSRIKAILKREKSSSSDKEELNVGNLKINKNSYTVTLGDKQLVLPKKEFELLFLLASKPGKVLTRETILDEVWGRDVYVVDRTIDVHIRKIREKIGNKKITTIKGVGYKFEV